MLRWSNQPVVPTSAQDFMNAPLARLTNRKPRRNVPGRDWKAGSGCLCRLRSRACIWFGSLARFSMLILSTGVNKARGDEAAAKLKSEGGEVGHLEIDLGDSATIASAAQSINTDFGHLDILLSNAGIVGLGAACLRVAVLMQSSGLARKPEQRGSDMGP